MLSVSRRAAPVAACRCLQVAGSDREPVVFQVGTQVLDSHPIDPGRSLVALHLRQRFLQILTLENCFHRRPCDRRAFVTELASVSRVVALWASPFAPVSEFSSTWFFCRMARTRLLY